jgi:hypothetical protein
MEKDLELLGATAIEDKLQEGVPQTITALQVCVCVCVCSYRSPTVRLYGWARRKRTEASKRLFLPL